MFQRFVLLLALMVPLSMHAQTTRLDTVRHLNVRPGGGYSAIWGYTAPDGREYAILGCNGSSGRPAGTSIIDITDDVNPREVAFISGPASSWREMKTYGHYAYVVSEASNSGVQIIDLSGLPDSAVFVRTFTYTSGANNIGRNHTITIADGYMYLNGSANWSPGGMLIFDLRNDPLVPEFVGMYQPEYIHDSYVLRDTIYASAINSNGGLYIADAKNKTNVRTIGKITYTGSGTHNAWVTKDRRYVITTDEIGSTPKTLKFWDISTLPAVPANPTATFTPVPGQIVHNVTVRGDYAYVAWYSAGVRVVNISNPAVPLDAGGYDTNPSTSGYSGIWGIYPYFPSGKIIAGDMGNGLWVFRFSDLSPRRAVRLLSPANGDTLRGTSAVLRWSKAADLLKDPHWYEISLTGPGIDTTWVSADSLSLFSGLSRLQDGQTYTWRVTTRDEWNTTRSGETFSFIFRASTPAGVSIEVPLKFELSQNYPNPFNPVTKIDFSLSKAGLTTLKVYDMLGKEVATLVNEVLGQGFHFRAFNASNLASGVYLYRLHSSEYVQTRRMVVVR